MGGKKFAQQGAEASNEATEEANEATKKANKAIAHTMKRGLSKMERVVQEAHKVNQQESTDAKEAFGRLDHTSKKKHQSLKQLLHNDFKSVVMAEAKKHATQKPVQPDILDQLHRQTQSQGVIEDAASSVFDGLAFPMDQDDDEDEKKALSDSSSDLSDSSDSEEE